MSLSLRDLRIHHTSAEIKRLIESGITDVIACSKELQEEPKAIMLLRRAFGSPSENRLISNSELANLYIVSKTALGCDLRTHDYPTPEVLAGLLCKPIARKFKNAVGEHIWDAYVPTLPRDRDVVN